MSNTAQSQAEAMTGATPSDEASRKRTSEKPAPKSGSHSASPSKRTSTAPPPSPDEEEKSIRPEPSFQEDSPSGGGPDVFPYD